MRGLEDHGCNEEGKKCDLLYAHAINNQNERTKGTRKGQMQWSPPKNAYDHTPLPSNIRSLSLDIRSIVVEVMPQQVRTVRRTNKNDFQTHAHQ